VAARLLATLDALIAAFAALVLVYLVAGGFDLGILSARRFSKPFLVLLVLGAVRAAIPRPSWLSRLLQAGAGRVAAARARLEARSPLTPAVVDALAAVLCVHVLTKGTAFLANLIFGPARPRPFPMPFESLRFLLELCARRSRPLKAGAWVSTGAITGVHEIVAGQSARVSFGDAGEVHCRAEPHRGSRVAADAARW